jgi:hypothetical protein
MLHRGLGACCPRPAAAKAAPRQDAAHPPGAARGAGVLAPRQATPGRAAIAGPPRGARCLPAARRPRLAGANAWLCSRPARRPPAAGCPSARGAQQALERRWSRRCSPLSLIVPVLPSLQGLQKATATAVFCGGGQRALRPRPVAGRWLPGPPSPLQAPEGSRAGGGSYLAAERLDRLRARKRESQRAGRRERAQKGPGAAKSACPPAAPCCRESAALTQQKEGWERSQRAPMCARLRGWAKNWVGRRRTKGATRVLCMPRTRDE